MSGSKAVNASNNAHERANVLMDAGGIRMMLLFSKSPTTSLLLALTRIFNHSRRNRIIHVHPPS